MTLEREIYRRAVEAMIAEPDPQKRDELEEMAREAWRAVEDAAWGSRGLGVR